MEARGALPGVGVQRGLQVLHTAAEAVPLPLASACLPCLGAGLCTRTSELLLMPGGAALSDSAGSGYPREPSPPHSDRQQQELIQVVVSHSVWLLFTI